MELTELLKGKMVNVMTDAKVIVQLEIKEANETNHSVNLEPATRENDWWPKSRDWKTIDVTFINGFKKSYESISQIDVAKPTPQQNKIELQILKQELKEWQRPEVRERFQNVDSTLDLTKIDELLINIKQLSDKIYE